MAQSEIPAFAGTTSAEGVRPLVNYPARKTIEPLWRPEWCKSKADIFARWRELTERQRTSRAKMQRRYCITQGTTIKKSRGLPGFQLGPALLLV